MLDEATKQWTIFLCHSKEDEHYAQWLYMQLHRRNISVWFEPSESLVGDSRLQRITEGLQNSLFLLVVISQHSITSPWVKAELEPSIIQQVDQSKTTILPVSVDGTSPEQVSLLLKGRYSFPIPFEASEVQFAELIRQIKQQLEKQGRSDLATSIVEMPAHPTSPYPYGFKEEVQPDRFIVPEVTINNITEYLVEGLSVSLVGPRMIGKTSLLNFFKSEFYRTYYWQKFLKPENLYLEYSQRLNGQLSNMKFVNIDLEDYVLEGAEALMSQLARSIAQVLNEDFQETNYLSGIKWLREHIEMRSIKKGIFWILLLDNLDSITKFDEIPVSFFDVLHNLGSRYRLCYIASSRKDLKELSQLETIKPFKDSSFFTMFKKYNLGVWDNATAKKLILCPYGTMTNSFNPADISLIMQLTARHPRLLQQACEQLLKRTTKGERKNIEQFFQHYQMEADEVYAPYWENEISQKERDWLKNCWKVLSQTGTRAKDEVKALIVGEENQQILEKLRAIERSLVTSSNLEQADQSNNPMKYTDNRVKNRQILEKMSELELILKRAGDPEQADQSNNPEPLLEDVDVIEFSGGFKSFLSHQF